MSQYGIPNLRDADGQLKGVDHTYEWNGQEITIKHIPITSSEQQEIESHGRDIDVEVMQNLLDKKIVKPEVEGEWSLAEILCYFEGIVDFAGGGGGEVMAQAREELERRAEEESGN